MKIFLLLGASWYNSIYVHQCRNKNESNLGTDYLDLINSPWNGSMNLTTKAIHIVQYIYLVKSDCSFLVYFQYAVRYLNYIITSKSNPGLKVIIYIYFIIYKFENHWKCKKNVKEIWTNLITCSKAATKGFIAARHA